MQTETTTTTVCGTLADLADLARVMALYASSDPHRHMLQQCQINPTNHGIEAVATDSYTLAAWTNPTVTTTTTVTLPAHDLHKATAAAVKAAGKKNAATIQATITTTDDTWTLTAGPLTTSGPRPNIDYPNLDNIRTTTETPATFEPYALGAEYLARLAKTPNNNTAQIIHHHYSSPLKPMHYTCSYNAGNATIEVSVIIMPQRMNP